jgi:hypothetical protein
MGSIRLSTILELFLSPAGLARLEFLSRDHRLFYRWGGPMNAQIARLDAARAIIFGCEIERIVETGAHRGATTEWLAAFGLPVVGVELNPRLASFSRLRLRKWPQVEIRAQHSVQCLKDIARRPGAARARTLFYLDAHGGDSLPLRDELEVIFGAFPKAVVLIDDFAVPGDPGYGFDDYGPGRVINLDYVERSRLPPLHLFFPATPSRFETGRRRGWVVATADGGLATRLGKLAALLPWAARAAA